MKNFMIICCLVATVVMVAGLKIIDMNISNAIPTALQATSLEGHLDFCEELWRNVR